MPVNAPRSVIGLELEDALAHGDELITVLLILELARRDLVLEDRLLEHVSWRSSSATLIRLVVLVGSMVAILRSRSSASRLRPAR